MIVPFPMFELYQNISVSLKDIKDRKSPLPIVVEGDVAGVWTRRETTLQEEIEFLEAVFEEAHSIE